MKILTLTILQHLVLALKFCAIFYLILGLNSSFGADQRYEACLPRGCGNGVNISFPFYIPNLQDSSCGYPGFEINCNGTFPILHLPESYYVVSQIFYHNQSVRVYNVISVLTSDLLTNCDIVKSIRNTSLPSGELRLEYYENVTDLYLFSKCKVNSWTSDNFMNNVFACMGFSAAMLEGDESLSVALRDCETNAVAPVEMLPKVQVSNNADYAEVLRKGFVLNWRENDCNTCKISGGNCGFDKGFRCFCPDRPHAKTCNEIDSDPTPAVSPNAELQTGAPPPLSDHKEIKEETIFSKPLNKGIMIIVVIGIFGFALLLALVCFLMFLLRNYKFKYVKQHERNQIELNLNPGPKHYEYSYLKKITNSFSESNKLGKGGYGTVFKGMMSNGREVAVKVLMSSEINKRDEDFKNEVSSISRTAHNNIVTLLGYCYEGQERALVYEFVPNGSLSRCIQKNASSKAEHELELENKLEIAVGIARGLEYLHKDCNQGILHGDLKPENILLDKDWKPKISDFGVATLCTGSAKTKEVANLRGTVGYFAPERLYNNVISPRSDVYSYGLIVLELVVGMEKNNPRAKSSIDETYFPDWIYKHLHEQNTATCLDGTESEDKSLIERRMLIAGLKCIQGDAKERPTIREVLEMLQGSMERLEIPTYQPYSSSHPTGEANASARGSKLHSHSLPPVAAIVSTDEKFHSCLISAANASSESKL